MQKIVGEIGAKALFMGSVYKIRIGIYVDRVFIEIGSGLLSKIHYFKKIKKLNRPKKYLIKIKAIKERIE